MILVNNPGNWKAVYWPLRHAEWHGWTPTDLVFPFFVFIVGVSIVFSCSGRCERGEPRGRSLRHALWRSAVLIALGMVLNGLFYLPWAEVRIPGVLQRIGIVYFLAMLITTMTKRRVRIAVTAGILLGYWALLALVPAPGHVAGDFSAAGNLASYVDRALLRGHMWRATFDPEGVLSTLPAIATALLGTMAGEWIRSGHARVQIAAGLVTAGAAGVVAGEIWGTAFPINKNLWTSSYVVFTAGAAAMVLGICYWLVDVCGWRGVGRPFAILGMNPLAIYVASEMVGMVLQATGAHDAAFLAGFAPLAAPAVASLLWAAAYVTAWWLVAWTMYRNTIFIKL